MRVGNPDADVAHIFDAAGVFEDLGKSPTTDLGLGEAWHCVEKTDGQKSGVLSVCKATEVTQMYQGNHGAREGTMGIKPPEEYFTASAIVVGNYQAKDAGLPVGKDDPTWNNKTFEDTKAGEWVVTTGKEVIKKEEPTSPKEGQEKVQRHRPHFLIEGRVLDPSRGKVPYQLMEWISTESIVMPMIVNQSYNVPRTPKVQWQVTADDKRNGTRYFHDIEDAELNEKIEEVYQRCKRGEGNGRLNYLWVKYNDKNEPWADRYIFELSENRWIQFNVSYGTVRTMRRCEILPDMIGAPVAGIINYTSSSTTAQ